MIERITLYSEALTVAVGWDIDDFFAEITEPEDVGSFVMAHKKEHGALHAPRRRRSAIPHVGAGGRSGAGAIPHRDGGHAGGGRPGVRSPVPVAVGGGSFPLLPFSSGAASGFVGRIPPTPGKDGSIRAGGGSFHAGAASL